MKLLERAAIALVSLALALVIIVLLSGGLLAGRDNPQLYGGDPAQLGASYADQGNTLLPSGVDRPHYDSDPPTSGPHLATPVPRDGIRLSNDQLLQVLGVGDVVLMSGTRHPPAGLTALARSVAGPYSTGLARGGQAVILAWRPGIHGVLGLAWTHILVVAKPADPRLREFAVYWLGRGAGG